MKAFWVLLVEDCLDHAELVKMALVSTKIACHLTHVEDGEVAMQTLEAAEQHGRLPDLVFLDINMPIINGHQFLRWLKSDTRLRTITVVMLTTSEKPSDISESYLAYANSYIVKPTSYPDLKNLLCEVIHYWAKINTAIIKMELKADTLSRPSIADILPKKVPK